jgi:hypothetical protein
MKIFLRKWCVYSHLVGGKCIYIGMGRPRRAFGNVPARSSEWFALAKDGYDVEILSWHETKAECLARETEVIREASPLCNKMHNGWVPDAFKANWKPGRRSPRVDRQRSARGGEGGQGKVPVVCVETGESFDSLSRAASRIGVSVAAVSKAVATGRPILGTWTVVREATHV